MAVPNGLLCSSSNDVDVVACDFMLPAYAIDAVVSAMSRHLVTTTILTSIYHNISNTAPLPQLHSYHQGVIVPRTRIT